MEAPQHLLLFLTTPRVGSSVFADNVRRTRVLGTGAEYFHGRRLKSLGDQRELKLYVTEELLREATSYPTFSACMMWPHMSRIEKILEGRDPFAFLQEAVGADEMSLVRISRQDKLRQAVSLVRAQQTGKWGSKGTAVGEERYDRHAIEKAILRLVKDESRWEACIERWGRSTKSHLVYENDLFTKEEREQAVVSILKLLGFDEAHAGTSGATPEQGLKRQSDGVTESWLQTFIDS